MFCSHGLGPREACLQFFVRGRCAVGPLAEVVFEEGGEALDPERGIVETGDVMELLAAGLEKSGAAFHADLFQRFEAIGGKAGAEDIDARHSLAGEPLQGGLGIGFEPAGAPEARLEGDEPLVGGEPKPLGHEPRRLVANLPYNVAVPVILTLLERLPSLETVLVMVQAEVADRLAAGPGSRTYGVPSVKVAWYADAARGAKVSRTVFWPVPNVDSALVSFTRHPILTDTPREEVFAVVDAAFAQRRKTLRAALASWAGSPACAEEILVEAGVSPQARGEKLGIYEFIAIADAARRFSKPVGGAD